MYVDETVGDKPSEADRERDRERKREEEVRSMRKMETCNIRGLFSHTQKGLVDVLRAQHGDAPFDRPRGRGSRACTGFRIVVVVLTNKSAA